EVLRRVRNNHFTWTSLICNLETHLSCQATDSTVQNLTLSCMQSCSHRNIELRRISSDRDGGANRARRSIKNSQRSITVHVDFSAPEPLNLFRNVRPKTPQHFIPIFAKSPGVFLRIHNSRVQDR